MRVNGHDATPRRTAATRSATRCGPAGRPREARPRARACEHCARELRAGIVVTGTEVLSGLDRGRATARGCRSGCASAACSWRTRSSSATGREDLRAALRVPRRHGRGPDPHQRRPRPDRRRPHGRGRGATSAGAPMALDAALEERIWAIVERLHARFPAPSEEAMRAGARKQALVPDGRGGAGAGRHRAGAAWSPADGPLVLVLPGPPRELQPMWDGRAGDRAAARAAGRRRAAASSGSCACTACRRPRSRRRCAEIDAGPARWRSRPACAAASSRSRPCSRPAAEAAYDALEAALRERHADALFSADGGDDRRGGRAAAGGPDRRHRGVVHRRADGGPADRPRRLLGLRAGRRWSSTPTRPRSALAGVPAELIAAPRRRLARGRPRAGRRRARAPRRRHRHRHHRHRRAGRRHAGEAGRHGLPVRRLGATAASGAHRPASRARAPTSATARRRSRMHMLRALLAA